MACTRLNLERNPHLCRSRSGRAILFSSVPPGLTFDLITFNQPFFASTVDTYIAATSDGGRPVIVRFLDQVRARLNPGGIVLMSAQSTSGPENDPGLIAAELGHQVNVLVREDVGEISKFIYEIHVDLSSGR